MLTKTPVLSIICVLVASVLGAVGQFLFQYGAKHGKSGVIGFITNPYILTGMAVYITVMVFFTYAFKIGGTVRVLYPLYSSTFIWAAVIACLRYSQPIQPIHIVGMALLTTGMICMSW
jgi:uncharacterized membrane protein